MSWGFVVTGEAEKDLGRLDRQTLTAIHQAIRNLLTALDGPHQPPPGTKQLRHVKPPTWRLRVGAWRVVYRLDRSANHLTILRVRHRSKVYRP